MLSPAKAAQKKVGDCVTVGPNLITNATFDSNVTGWLATGGVEWVIEWSSGRLRALPSGAGFRAFRSNGLGALVVGRRYNVSFNLQVLSGSVGIGFNSAIGWTAINRGVGNHAISISFIATATTNTTFSLSTSVPGTEVFLDNVYIRSITMALVSAGFWLTVTLRDSGGNPSNLTYDLVAATAANAATAAADILTRLALVTASEVSGYSLAERFQENAFVYPADAENENRAVITCSLNGFANKPVTVVIPAPVDGLFVQPAGGPGYNIVDITQADLISYIDIWRVTGALAQISDGEYIGDSGSILKGKRTHRQSSNG